MPTYGPQLALEAVGSRISFPKLRCLRFFPFPCHHRLRVRVTSSKSRCAIVAGLALLHVCILIGCGTSQPKKTNDPAKVEEQMKEYRDMSQKERSG